MRWSASTGGALRPAELASAELAAYLCEVSREIQRQVGILVDRRGEIEHVFVGDASRINLPEIGRLRAGRGRFRGLRLVHTHLRNEPLTRDDLVDLALLRLDLVAAIGVQPDGRPADLHVAHLLPPADGQAPSPGGCCPSEPFSPQHAGRAALIEALEEEFERVAPGGGRHRQARPRAAGRRRRARGRAHRRRAAPGADQPRAASPSCGSCAGPRGARDGRRRAAPPRGRPQVPGRARQAGGGADPRDAARRQRADLRSRPDAGAGARDRRLHRPQGHRPHDADPRHLRAAREEPRRQAAGRAGAAALPAAAPAREEHDDEPADRRHRRARPRRDQAGREPAPRARAHQPAGEGDRALRRAAGRAARRARARAACPWSPSSATPTPASPRC